MTASFSTTATACLKSFEELTKRAEQPDYRHEQEVSSVTWADELGRLRVWCANIGALQTGLGGTSPDRFGVKKGVTKQVTKLLDDLKKTLDECHEKVSEASSSASDEESLSDIPSSPTTELQDCRKTIVNIIDCLNDLSRIISKRARHIHDDASNGPLVEDDKK